MLLVVGACHRMSTFFQAGLSGIMMSRLQKAILRILASSARTPAALCQRLVLYFPDDRPLAAPVSHVVPLHAARVASLSLPGCAAGVGFCCAVFYFSFSSIFHFVTQWFLTATPEEPHPTTPHGARCGCHYFVSSLVMSLFSIHLSSIYILTVTTMSQSSSP